MPGRYVFPGGRVDAGDARVKVPVDLRPEVSAQLSVGCTPGRARALAMAAVRETFEETGLIVGYRVTAPIVTRSPGWAPFFATGYVPALDRLDYVARAITPPGRVRRFDARFFLVDAAGVGGTLAGNGELEDLRWVPLREVHRLAVAPVTRRVLELLADRFIGAKHTTAAGIPLLRHSRGRELLEYH